MQLPRILRQDKPNVIARSQPWADDEAISGYISKLFMQTELKNISIKSGAGFTLIEMIVTMAILISIMGFGLFLSMDYYRSFIFFHEKDLVISILHKARSQSLANINQSWHGIKIETDNYIIFEGNDEIHDYDHRDITKDVPPYEASKTITLSGMTEVVFTQLTATSTPVGGDLTLSDGIRSIIISINDEGRISQN